MLLFKAEAMKLFGLQYVIAYLGYASSSCVFDTFVGKKLPAVTISEMFSISGSPMCKRICQRENTTCAGTNVIYSKGTGLICITMLELPALFEQQLQLDSNSALYVKKGEFSIVNKKLIINASVPLIKLSILCGYHSFSRFYQFCSFVEFDS